MAVCPSRLVNSFTVTALEIVLLWPCFPLCRETSSLNPQGLSYRETLNPLVFTACVSVVPQEALVERHLHVHTPEESHTEKTQPASRKALGRARISHLQLPSDRDQFTVYSGAFPGRKAGLSV